MGRLAADVRWFLSEDNFFRMGIWAEFVCLVEIRIPSPLWYMS